MNNWIKNSVLKIIPNSTRIRYLVYRRVLEDWKKKSGQYPFFEHRFEMYNYVNQEILEDEAIEYLEFGVFKGDSIKHFAQLNGSEASTFVGFDTFEGLPEDWVEFSRTVKSKTFSTDGGLPIIGDHRISFIKGLFQDTLPEFLRSYQPKNRIVIHNDSDLYSATLYVLTMMNEYLISGTVIIFDEFYSALDEFRALEDFCSAYMREYKVLAATNNHTQVAIEIL